jgi:AraC family transcriptional regulator
MEAMIRTDAAALLGRLLADASLALETDREIARHCLAQATVVLQQHAATGVAGSAVTAYARGGLAGWQSKLIRRQIEDNLGSRICISDLANLVGLSPSHFFRAFRETFGAAPMAYVIRMRITRAQQIMLRSTRPLSQVALECGLCDQAHFTRMFRQVVGMTPRQWRRDNFDPHSDTTTHRTETSVRTLGPLA